MNKLTKIPAFGFLQSNAVVGTTKFTPSMAVWHNVRKIVGYIPGLSLIQGIEHLVRAMQNKKDYSSHFIFRSIVEMLGFGFFLLIPDIIVTCVRQQKSVPPTLQHRKIVPMPLPQPAANPTFPAKIEEFVEPIKTEKIREQPKLRPKTSPVIANLIKEQFKKLVDLNQVSKLQSYLERSKLAFDNKTEIESLKEFITEAITLSEDATYILMEYLYTNEALTESLEDVAFYTKLGITLAEAGKNPTTLCEHLDLDPTKEHCLKALTAIAIADAKCNPGNMHERIEHYGIPYETEEQGAAYEQIAKVAVQHDPAGTLDHLEAYNMTHATKELTQLAYALGTFEEKMAKAIKLAHFTVSALMSNWKYLDFKSDVNEELQVGDALPPATLLTHSLALETAKKSDFHLTQFVNMLKATSSEGEKNNALLKEIGVAILKKYPHYVMKNNLLFGFDVDFILSEIKKLSEEPLEAKEEILRGMIEHMPMNFSGCSAFMLKNTPEELELKKKLIIKLIQTHLPLVNPDHSDKTELKKMILTAVSTATYKEAEQILQKHHLLIEAGICPTKGDYDFYSCLACALAKKTPNALSTFKHLFNPKDVIGFQTLREIGLSLATLDGAGFKKDAKLLGFERNDKRHASALKQMIQLAIADDGDKNLEAFGKLAPQPNIEVLSIKQACNLVVLHAGDPAYNPMKYIDYVPKQEWESPEGLAAIDQLIADVAPKSINIAQALVSFFSKDPETHFKKGELPEKEDQDYLQMLKTALKLDPKKPADRQKLRECAMIVVKKYPKETLELAAHKLQLDVSDAEDLICFTHVFKEAAKTHAKLVFEIVNSYDSTFSTDAQRAAITEIFKEVVKQLGFDHFPFSATFWKMAKVQQALYKEVPPPFYKGIKLY